MPIFGIEHVSPSSLSTLAGCPRRWKKRYVDKLPDVSGFDAAVGSFIHEVLEDLLALDSNERTMDTALELCSALWVKDLVQDEDERKSLPNVLKELDAYTPKTKQRVAKLLENYFKVEDPRNVEFVSLEEDYLIPLWDDISLKMIIDRKEATRISDYKSGKRPNGQYVPKSLIQLFIYCYGLSEIGEDYKEANLIYFGDNPGIITATNVDAHFVEIRKYLDRGVNMMRKKLEEDLEFKPKVGPLCAYCPYVADCPKGMSEVNRMISFGRVKPSAPVWKIIHEQQLNMS